MGNAQLRGYVEISAEAVRPLEEAGYPVEVRYFIPKAGTKAGDRVVRPNKALSRGPGNFIGLGPKTPEGLKLRGGRRLYGERARAAIESTTEKVVRRHLLRAVLAKNAPKGQTHDTINSQITHLVLLGVLKDHGQTPPTLLGVKVKGGQK